MDLRVRLRKFDIRITVRKIEFMQSYTQCIKVKIYHIERASETVEKKLIYKLSEKIVIF